jgi:hypothetical protein
MVSAVSVKHELSCGVPEGAVDREAVELLERATGVRR